MKLFGFEIARIKAQTLATVPSNGGGFFGLIREAWSGAFQQHVTVDGQKDVLAFSAVFACVTRIASDIAKMRIKLVEEDEDGICTEVEPGSPFLPVLRKPNHFQTRIKFIEQWMVSKLLHGNAYALKERDARGMVVALYLLDPQRVKPLVAESGDVYYELSADHLSGLVEKIIVPARQIIHDTMVCLWHPLVGVSPIYACAMSATHGRRIQSNSTRFFSNMSRPSGMLVVPGSITTEEAHRMKAEWNENHGPGKEGGVAVLAGGLKYETMTVAANDAQLIEQLRWTVEDVARCFGMPLFKIGGAVPAGSSIEALNLMYYSDCLQSLIESCEAHLDEGLELKPTYYTDFDLDGLIRMDQVAQITMLSESVKGSIRSPDEARAKLNLKPVPGGGSPMAQQQNYSLAALAKRDASNDPFGTAKPAAVAPPAKDEAANDDETVAADESAKKKAEYAAERAKLEAERAELARQHAAQRESEDKARREREDAARLARQKIEDEERAARLRAEDDERRERAERERDEELAERFIHGLTDDSAYRAEVTRAELSHAPANLMEVDSQIRASVGIVTALASSVSANAERVDATLEAVIAAAKHTEQSQARVAKSMERLAEVLQMPVEPVHDKNGIVKGARRVEKLSDD